MLILPMDKDCYFAIVEPFNIQQLKLGRPMMVGPNMIAYTPDMPELVRLLGMDANVLNVKQGEWKETQGHWTPEQLDGALKATIGRKEVFR